MKIFLSGCMIIFSGTIAFCQSIGLGTEMPHASSMMEIASPDKGILIPRLSLTQRPISPATGLLYYQTDNTPGFYYYDGITWKFMQPDPFTGTGADGQVVFWNNSALSGSNSLFWDNTIKRLGIDTIIPAAGLHVAGQDGLVVSGTFGMGATTGTTGGGTRMLFNPRKGAFRAGRTSNTQWDDANIGNYSVAFGQNTVASGIYSIAMGSGSIASAQNAIALGQSADATSIGAIGIGASANALEELSMSLGAANRAYARGSSAIGFSNRTYGDYSAALGFDNFTRSYGEFSVGMNNTDYTAASSTSWVGTDRVFSVGNGTDHDERSNAMVILKNGNMGIGIEDPQTKLQLENGSFRIGNSEDSKNWDIAYDATGNFLYIDEFGSSRRMVFENGGNVGIGITDPSTLLEVGGSFKANSVQISSSGSALSILREGQAIIGPNMIGNVLVIPVSFGATLTSIPHVNVTILTENYTDMFISNIRNITTSGFDVLVYRADTPGATWAQNLKLNWMAVL